MCVYKEETQSKSFEASGSQQGVILKPPHHLKYSLTQKTQTSTEKEREGDTTVKVERQSGRVSERRRGRDEEMERRRDGGRKRCLY